MRKGQKKTWRSGPPSRSPGKDELERLYLRERLTYAQIGERYGVAATSVMRWMRAAGVETLNPRQAQLRSPKYVGVSDEAKERLRASLDVARKSPKRGPAISRAQKGRVPWNKGKNLSPEHVAKLTAARSTPEYRERLAAMRRGAKNPRWRGGKIPGEDKWAKSWEWKARRRECYARDNWTCQDCGVKCTNGIRIQAHHIVPRRAGGGDELENLVTLCVGCHHKRERKIG